MRKVLVTGTFDVLHKGHLEFFRQARQHGNYLVAIVALDETVEKVKGEQPLHSQKLRLKAVKESGFVNKAVLGNVVDKYQKVQEEDPDVICLGYDQEAFTRDLKGELEKRELKAEIVRLKAYKPGKYKSSLIKESIKMAGLKQNQTEKL